MVLAPNLYCQNCLPVILAMRGNRPLLIGLKSLHRNPLHRHQSSCNFDLTLEIEQMVDRKVPGECLQHALMMAKL